MTLRGIIKFQRAVNVNGRECYGATYARRNRFTIRIAEIAGDGLYLFAETVLHEFLHLWIFVLQACAKVDLSDRAHHRLINRVMPVALRELRKVCGGRR